MSFIYNVNVLHSLHWTWQSLGAGHVELQGKNTFREQYTIVFNLW